MPSLPAEVLVEQYGNIERYLERTLGIPVVLLSATSYEEFDRHMLGGAYDLAVVAPHLALYAQRRAAWMPLGQVTPDIQPIVIALRDSTIGSLEDLRGRMLVLPDAIALVSMETELQLARLGMQTGRDIKIRNVPNHASVMALVESGREDAGAVSSQLFERLPEARRQHFRVIHRFARKFGIAFMASPRIGAERIERVRAALLRFADAPEGRAYFAQEPRLRVQPLTVAELQEFSDLEQRMEQIIAAEHR